jgi:hypothetical protein
MLYPVHQSYWRHQATQMMENNFGCWVGQSFIPISIHELPRKPKKELNPGASNDCCGSWFVLHASLLTKRSQLATVSAVAITTMFQLKIVVAIVAFHGSVLANLRVPKDNQALLQPDEPQAVVPNENPESQEDPVSFFESILPPRLRRMGLTQNPLQCVGNMLAAGDKLLIGQAACFNGYEFGLADNGKVTFFDHWNHHPEVVVWQEPTAKGSYLYLDPNGGGLTLYNNQDEAVWQIGTTTTSGSSAVNILEVTENGTVELSSHGNGGQKVHWSMNLDGEVTVA